VDDELERLKRASTAQLLFKCARLLNERALSRIELPDGSRPVRAAHTTLFPHIDSEGSRITDIAAKLGITKQAVGQLVDDLEEWGVVERRPDPSDGRAKLVVWKREAMIGGLQTLGTVEDEMEELLGERKMRALHRMLETVHDWLVELETGG